MALRLFVEILFSFFVASQYKIKLQLPLFIKSVFLQQKAHSMRSINVDNFLHFNLSKKNGLLAKTIKQGKEVQLVSNHFRNDRQRASSFKVTSYGKLDSITNFLSRFFSTASRCCAGHSFPFRQNPRQWKSKHFSTCSESSQNSKVELMSQNISNFEDFKQGESIVEGTLYVLLSRREPIEEFCSSSYSSLLIQTSFFFGVANPSWDGIQSYSINGPINKYITSIIIEVKDQQIISFEEIDNYYPMILNPAFLSQHSLSDLIPFQVIGQQEYCVTKHPCSQQFQKTKLFHNSSYFLITFFKNIERYKELTDYEKFFQDLGFPIQSKKILLFKTFLGLSTMLSLAYLYSLKDQNTVLMKRAEIYKWKPITIQKQINAPKPRWGHKIIQVDHQSILMYGGFGGSELMAKYLDDLWIFNFTNNQWSLVETFGQHPGHRSNYTIHYNQVQNQIIVFGGASQGKVKFNSIHALNWQSKVWRKIALPQTQTVLWERTYHSSELIFPYLVVFGGESCANIDLNDLWVFNFLKNQWRQISFANHSQAPDPRRFHSSSFLNNYLYIIGGCSGSEYTKYGDIYRVNLSKLLLSQIYDDFQWQCVIKSNKCLQRWGHSSDVFKGQIYITFGRISPVQDSHDTFVFDPQLKTLEKLDIDSSYCPQARRRHASTLIGSALILFGGYNGNYLQEFEYLSLKTCKQNKKTSIQCILKENYEQMEKQVLMFFEGGAKKKYFHAISPYQVQLLPQFPEKRLIQNQFLHNLFKFQKGKRPKIRLPQFTELIHFQLILMSLCVNKMFICSKPQTSFLQKLIQTADYFYMPQVILIVQDLLISTLNDNNCQKLSSISSKYGLEVLSFRCKEFYITKTYSSLEALIKLNRGIRTPLFPQAQSKSSKTLTFDISTLRYEKSLIEVFEFVKFDLFQSKIHESKSSFLVNLLNKIKNIFKCQDQQSQSQQGLQEKSDSKLFRFGRFISKMCTAKDSE